MTLSGPNPPPAPRFGINDVVYSRESAIAGFLEAFHVGSIAYSTTNEPVYTVQIASKSGVTASFGDRITKKRSTDAIDVTAVRQLGNVISFLESELVDLCEAATLVRSTLEHKLQQIELIIAQQCPGSVS
jgi:hypothetical protein